MAEYIIYLSESDPVRYVLCTPCTLLELGQACECVISCMLLSQLCKVELRAKIEMNFRNGQKENY